MNKKKIIDMGKNTQFIPEIWSEYILDKFRELSTPFKDLNGRSQYMIFEYIQKGLSSTIKKVGELVTNPPFLLRDRKSKTFQVES